MSGAPKLRLVDPSLAALEEHDRYASRELGEGRVPPHNLDAEASVIASALLDGGALVVLESFLLPEHFYSEAHRQIFAAMLDVRRAGTSVDVTTVGERLRATGRIAQVGGLTYLTEILNGASAILNVREHGEIVFDLSRVRRTIATAQTIAAKGYGDLENLQAFIDDSARSLVDLAGAQIGRRRESNPEALRRILDTLTRAAKSGDVSTGWPTGLPSFDRLTFGLHPGKVLVVGALTGHGKTSFGLQIAANICESANVGALIVSPEMSPDELRGRVLARYGGVDSQRIEAALRGQVHLTGDEWNRLIGAMDRMAHLSFDFEDGEGITIDAISGSVVASIERRRLRKEPPLAVVVIDSMQMLSAPEKLRFRKKHEQVTYVAEQAKMLAKRHGVAVVVLAQAKVADGPKRKRAADPDERSIAESNNVGRWADLVVFLHRGHRYSPTGKILGEDKRRIRLIMPKQRAGKSKGDGDEGEVLLKFEPEYSRFVDIEGDSASVPDPQNYFDDMIGER